jgi:hypothetical protein
VLASFVDCLVIVGGWVPDLLLPDETDPHVGSIDVDLALDAAKLNDGRYAELIKLLLDTKRYRPGEKDFQLVADVDLKDDLQSVRVQVEFLAPKNVRLKNQKAKRPASFRVLQVEACSEAFHNPVAVDIFGQGIRGARNKVRMRVASLADFLVMKAHAIGGRDKPKDTYDLCYCLERIPGGMDELAKDWVKRANGKNIVKAVEILREKFGSVDAFGPQQLVEFHSARDPETQAMHARRAYELVRKLLSML